MSPDLPTPLASQAYVHVSVLDSGHLTLPEHIVIQGGSPTSIPIVPAMSFLLRHSHHGTLILFDLGVRKDWGEYPPSTIELIRTYFNVSVPIDVVDSLRRGGIEPHDIEAVILSHIHFDHVGNPELFPSTRFVAHEDAKHILAGGYTPGDPAPASFPRFSKYLLPEQRTTFLSMSTHKWEPLGPFPHAHDYFGDGSVYVIDAPGHMPGHINLLVRTSPDGSWLYLAGDSAHDVRLVTGEKEIATFTNPDGSKGCMHLDEASAKEHLKRIREVRALPRVHVLLSHDLVWFEENKNKGILFPGEIPPL